MEQAGGEWLCTQKVSGCGAFLGEDGSGSRGKCGCSEGAYLKINRESTAANPFASKLSLFVLNLCRQAPLCSNTTPRLNAKATLKVFCGAFLQKSDKSPLGEAQKTKRRSQTKLQPLSQDAIGEGVVDVESFAQVGVSCAEAANNLLDHIFAYAQLGEARGKT